MSIDNDSNSSLLAYLRHELRTPINAIIGYSEMLLEELEEETDGVAIECTSSLEQTSICYLQNIQDCGVQLLTLVNNLLHPAKLEDDCFQLDQFISSEILQVQLGTPLTKVVDSCQYLLEQVEGEFQTDVNKIYTAAERLSKMAKNFVDVAQKYQSVINSELAPNSGNQEETTKMKQSALTDCFDSTNKLDCNTEATLCNPNQYTILVVDDNETNRDLLSRQIEAQGYKAVTSADGQQALHMIQTGEYDLILLDLIMPKMNGYQVLKSLRNSQWRNIPVIMISALDEIDSVVKCIEMGAEDYLSKPFNSVLLKARIGACLEQKRLRDRETLYLDQLTEANAEITSLNDRLQAENLRLSAELDITRRLQQMILPKEKELSQIDNLEISGFMEPAEEVGGDYYDVLQNSGRVRIGIGDVTGHGLESGVLMIMVQTAVRTLIENNETDPKKFFGALNRTIYKNVQRMDSDKNLTFCLVDYHEGKLNLSGQHEEIVVVRSGGEIERIDTIDLGFPIGLEEKITDFVFQTQIELNSGDIVVLYTDGITEAENTTGGQYGLEKLCEIVKNNWQKPAKQIRQLVINDLREYIGKHKVYDDITLVVIKQK